MIGTMFSELLEKLLRREDLTTEEASAAMNVIMDGGAQPSQIAGLLIALAMKGERPAEVVGFAQTMRARATRLSQDYRPVFDTCGTGGDRAHTFNVSTIAALVLAACGVRVAKHGNRSVSSQCGSADLFEALGVNVAAEPSVVERCLAEAGIAFFFAPTFHPSMRHAGPARRELGVRTAFNLLGPLTNPAGAARQLVGVPRPELTELVARSVALLGSERAWVVHGADGLDEISTGGYTKVSECRDGEVNTFYLHPTDIGLSKSAPDALRHPARRCVAAGPTGWPVTAVFGACSTRLSRAGVSLPVAALSRVAPSRWVPSKARSMNKLPGRPSIQRRASLPAKPRASCCG